MKKAKPLTSEQLHGLENQAFNLQQPGRILKDFGNLLKFIEDNGFIEVSPKNHLCAMKLLPVLNQLMTYPLDVQLKRPLQKSFPHLNALYLLLRASGLAFIETKGKKSRLTLNQSVLNSWKTLNNTERYFALLNAWFCHGNDEIIGERNNEFRHISDCLNFFSKLQNDKGVITLKDKNDVYFLNYMPGLHKLALMELFGFIEIQSGKPIAEEHWHISKITTTDWGSLVLVRIQQIGYGYGLWLFDENIDEDEGEDESAQSWETEFKTHIPEWKNDLQGLDTEVVTEGAFIFKVSLGKVYRKLAVPANSLLDDLASAILDAFSFDNDHLYEFIYKNPYGITESIAHPYSDSSHEFCTADAIVGQLPLQANMSFKFHFDFGDDWYFDIVVEAMASSNISETNIVVIEEHGEPPEQYYYSEEDDEPPEQYEY